MANLNEGRPEAVDFPDMENTPEEVKNTPEYSIRVTKAIIDKYKKGRTATSESWCSFWDTLRLYGLGRQPSSLYKTFLSGASASNISDTEDTTVQVDTRGEAAKGWYNIMWDDIVSFIPNLKVADTWSFLRNRLRHQGRQYRHRQRCGRRTQDDGSVYQHASCFRQHDKQPQAKRQNTYRRT